MTEFLVKKFVPDSENVQSAKVRTAYGVLSSVVGICCNVILFFAKLVVGIIINSVSVMADAFNNLSDAASSVISLVGVKIAARPSDKDHPFGHGRAEYIAVLLVAFVILEVGLSCIKSSLEKIFSPEAVDFSYVSIAILVGSMLVKLWLSFFNRKLAKKANSSVIKATATDSLNDVMVTGATVVSILLFKFFEVNLDGYIGIVVAILIFVSGINIIKDTVKPLIGEAPDPELCENLTQKVLSYEGIVGTHDLIVHNYGPSRFMATIHAEVPMNIDIGLAHETIDHIEREVYDELGVFLVIHMDPIEVDNEVVDRCRELVIDVIVSLEAGITMHDFRMVSGEEQTNLIFDIVVSHDYSDRKAQELVDKIKSLVNEKNNTYQCVITVDRSYT